MVGIATCPIIRSIRNNEIMGRHVFFLGLQKIFLPVLLLYSNPEVSQINNHEGRFCMYLTCNPKIERCKCAEGDIDSGQII